MRKVLLLAVIGTAVGIAACQFQDSVAAAPVESGVEQGGGSSGPGGSGPGNPRPPAQQEQSLTEEVTPVAPIQKQEQNKTPPQPELSYGAREYRRQCSSDHWNSPGCHLFEVHEGHLRSKTIQLQPLARERGRDQYVWFNGAELMVSWRDSEGHSRFSNNLNPSRVRLVENETVEHPTITYLFFSTEEPDYVNYCRPGSEGIYARTLDAYVEQCIGEIIIECQPNQCWPTR